MSENTTPQISEADRARMADMRRAGLTLDEIAQAYGITRVEAYQAIDYVLQAPRPAGVRVPVMDLPPKPSPQQQAKNSRTRKRMLIGIGAAFVVAIGIVIAVLATSGGSKSGFWNMTTLARSVQQSVNSDSAYGEGPVVESCAMVSGNTAECVVSPGFGNDFGDTGGATQGVTVLISANGDSWTQQ